MARALLEALRRRDVLADHVSTISDADALARDGSYDVLVLDRRLPDGEGLNLVASLRRSRHSCSSFLSSFSSTGCGSSIRGSKVRMKRLPVSSRRA